MIALAGWTYAQAVYAREALLRRLRQEGGQGTVEYVGLVLLIALVMFGLVAALKGYKSASGKALGDLIVNKIKDAVGKITY